MDPEMQPMPEPPIAPELAFLLGRCAGCDGPTHGFGAPLKDSQSTPVIWLPLCCHCREKMERIQDPTAYDARIRRMLQKLQERCDAWHAIRARWERGAGNAAVR